MSFFFDCWGPPGDSESTYTQVRLVEGFYFYVAWIPAEFAVVGKELTITTLSGTWTVEAVYESKLGKELHDHEAERKEFARVIGPKKKKKK